MGSWMLLERSEEALVNLCQRASIRSTAFTLKRDGTAWPG